MVKKSLLLAVAAAAGLSSCSNLHTPDSNHPDVLPPPMYRKKPVPTGASYITDHYHKHPPRTHVTNTFGQTVHPANKVPYDPSRRH